MNVDILNRSKADLKKLLWKGGISIFMFVAKMMEFHGERDQDCDSGVCYFFLAI